MFVNPQAFDVPGVSEYTVASNMVRNRIFYMEIRMPTGTGSAFIKHLLKILKAIKPPKMGRMINRILQS